MREYGADRFNLTMVFHEVTKSRYDGVNKTVERIMGVVRAMPYAHQENLDAIILAFTEALANAIIPGNREDRSKKVEIHGACEGQREIAAGRYLRGAGF